MSVYDLIQEAQRDRWFGSFDRKAEMEYLILSAGGVREVDWEFAWDRLMQSEVYGERCWGYLRAVALGRRAEIMELQEAAGVSS